MRRTGLSYVLLDEQEGPGGAWRHAWPSLRLFSPAQWSSLPGRLMPTRAGDEYPAVSDARDYLEDYENRYAVPVMRPVTVSEVRRDEEGSFRLDTSAGEFRSRAVVSATGSWANPFIPDIEGAGHYRGRTLHSARYPGIEQFRGERVIVVGGGNSGAQIVAELSEVADVTWATREPPTFLPDDVDGRYLFEQATLRHKAIQAGETPPPPRSLGDIVMVPAVKVARDRGALKAQPMFARFTTTGVEWSDGRRDDVDAVIFATGFRPALDHLRPLGVVTAEGRVDVRKGGSGTQAAAIEGLWLVGYGEWTGFASATLIGVGRSARAAVDELRASLRVS
jgi:cation diffusion facilitator CzcD-associated flavoprotein CzcO